MKYHRHLFIALLDSLEDVFIEGFYADKVIERYLKGNKKWGSRDRKFFAETHYDVIRGWRRFWAYLGYEYPEVGADLERQHLWEVVAVCLIEKGWDLGNFEEWDALRGKRVPDLAKLNIAEEISFPDWMIEITTEEFGEERALSILKSLNTPAGVILRTNTLKGTRAELKEKLLAEEIETVELPSLVSSVEPLKDELSDAIVNVALQLVERKNVFLSKLFKEGRFEVQDIASQAVAPFAEIKPGMTVIDACAGAGGKTLHLATYLKNKGRLFAMDVHDRKLEQLRLRCRRNGVDVVQTKLIENTKTIKRLADSGDRVLLDVPCSGMGVIRRNPDTKWKLLKSDLENIKALQAELLSSYSKMVKVDGKLIYSTCSLLPSENRGQIDLFLATHPNFEFEADHSFLPDTHQSDGFYMARLKRLS